MITRRQFLAASGTSLLTSPFLSPSSQADQFHKPLGVQLFTIRAELAKDFDGTLARAAAVGFREIEFAGYFGKTAEEIKGVTDALSLRCISTHHNGIDLETRSDEILEFAAKLNIKHLICSTPKSLSPEHVQKLSWNDYMYALTMDDWKENATLFNKFGEKANKYGIQFGYHNYCVEFRRFGNVNAYDELLRLTDPALVKIQLDCGWAAAAGISPLAIMQKFQRRIISLHLKDLKTQPSKDTPEKTPNVPLGQGIMNWHTLLRTAEKIGIEHYYLEQEPPYLEPIFDSLATSMRYLSTLQL